MQMLTALWAYRGFITGSVKREFQSKYRNSLLGAAWTILNPLAMVLVYTVIFSEIMRAKLPGVDNAFAYSIYLCGGIFTWGLFAEIIGRGQNVFLEHANLIKKLNFPRMCLPVIVILNASLNFFIVFGLFTLFLVATGNFPGWAYLAIFPVLLVQILFSIGLAIIIGVLNIFFRDVGHFFGIFLQFWFWLTPIVYPLAIVPDEFKPIMAFNPMLPLMTSYQGILVSGVVPEWPDLFPVILVSIGLCLFGMRLFRRRSGEMVDEL